MRNTALGNTLSNSLGPARLSLLAFLAVGSLSPSTASSQPARIERIFDIAIAGDAVVAGDQLYFIGNDGGGPELWVTDGTSVRTKMVRDIWQLGLVTPGRGPGSFPGPYWLTTAGDRVIFFASDGGKQSGIWAADRTGAWFLELDENPAALLGPAVPFGSRALIAARTAGVEGLWISNGLPSGTARLGEVQPSSYMDRSGEAPGRYFFGGRLSQGNFDLWTTDGRPRGTSLVATGIGGLNTPTPIGTSIYFVGSAAGPRRELWRHDTGLGRTEVLARLPPYADIVGVAGNTVVLWLEEAEKRRLFAWNEDLRRLLPLGEVDAGSLACCADFNGTVPVPGGFLFPGNDPQHGLELWVTDGTPTGTRLFKDLRPGPEGSNVQRFLPCGQQHVFATGGLDYSTRLWMTDGSIAGTVEFEEPAISAFGLSPLGCLGNALILASRDALFKLEIPIRR